MSSTSPPASSSTASTTSSVSSSATSTDTSSNQSSSEPSSLYLFTFLATLFLLLFVSAAIVLRSFIIRRRFRRRIEEAIAAGVYIPPPFGSPPGLRRALERPTLWDVFLMPASKDRWSETLPLAAKVAAPKPSLSTDSTPSLHESSADASVSRLALLRRPFARRRATSPSLTPSPDPSNPQPTESPAEDALTRAEEVQVAVMIMMPNPHRPAYGRSSPLASLKGKERSVSGEWDEEEEGIPDVVLGLTRVPRRVVMGGSPEL